MIANRSFRFAACLALGLLLTGIAPLVPGVQAQKQGKATATAAKAKTTTKPPVKPATRAATAKAAGAPKAGRWEATISNGYKGDVLTFRVSADGKKITDVEFKGHWRSRSYGVETLYDLDPPKPFAIANSSFSAVQTESDAGMWWEFTGAFKSATSAEGTYRATFAGGENDTYKLKWTAKRVGP